MGAEPGFAAEKQDLSIAIEVKSFFAESPIREFESTIGQYQIYRIILRSIDPERKLYLAVSDLAFKDFFQLPFAQKIMSELPMPMIVVDYFAEEVLQWIR